MGVIEDNAGDRIEVEDIKLLFRRLYPTCPVMSI